MPMLVRYVGPLPLEAAEEALYASYPRAKCRAPGEYVLPYITTYSALSSDWVYEDLPHPLVHIYSEGLLNHYFLDSGGRLAHSRERLKAREHAGRRLRYQVLLAECGRDGFVNLHVDAPDGGCLPLVPTFLAVAWLSRSALTPTQEMSVPQRLYVPPKVWASEGERLAPFLAEVGVKRAGDFFERPSIAGLSNSIAAKLRPLMTADTDGLGWLVPGRLRQVSGYLAQRLLSTRLAASTRAFDIEGPRRYLADEEVAWMAVRSSMTAQQLRQLAMSYSEAPTSPLQ